MCVSARHGRQASMYAIHSRNNNDSSTSTVYVFNPSD